jgi:hypothetical protein
MRVEPCDNTAVRGRGLHLVLGLLSLASAAAVIAQTDDAGAESPDPVRHELERGFSARLQENVGTLIRSFQNLGDWETQHGYMMSAIEKVYERNGWTDEPGLFALELTRAVESQPPWAFQQRFDTLIGALSDRYMLDEDQEQSLRETFIRATSETFQRHAPRIMTYAVEALQTRAAGEPFTADQVARWVELARPVMDDSVERMMRAVDRFQQQLDPEQQGILQQDLESAERRVEDMKQLMERWQRGEWTAEDWGLEEDPIQTGRGAATAARGEGAATRESSAPAEAEMEKSRGELAREIADRVRRRQEQSEPAAQERAAGETGSEEQAGSSRAMENTRTTGARSAPQDDDPWARHVREFIARYKLDAGQEARAWTIYGDAKERRDSLSRRYAVQIEGLRRRTPSGQETAPSPEAAKVTEKQKSAIDRLFDQMDRRLERLPTRAQRAVAKAVEPKPPRTTQPAPPAVNENP